MSRSVNLIVKALATVVAGKFVDQFVVIDETSGELVGKKAHKTEAEATAELGSLKFFAEGLSFARATAGEGATDKGLIAKANVVAAYLLYKEVGVQPAAEQEAGEAGEAEAPAAEEETFE
ncbi:hypothetical protein [Pseudomonas phage Nerthus]|uniref:Uncharacterized protein n=1 Tax=Pseudomonas phage Nerthus TaxID=2163984 RepID=A0A2S1GMP5_9CAUD|nr:hypothetical protein HOT09_gp18 [Pseudomonas phage Nerthus]AWD90650.1 hypothetical protein [Pseudomonas phage Nerthus]